MIEEDEKKSIPEIFKSYGEKYFRDAETKAIKNAAAVSGCVIATGGGAILREENVDALRQNGRLYFIDRPLSELIPTNDRPLSSDRDSIKKRYDERYEIYTNTADVIINANTDAEGVKTKILEDFFK